MNERELKEKADLFKEVNAKLHDSERALERLGERIGKEERAVDRVMQMMLYPQVEDYNERGNRVRVGEGERKILERKREEREVFRKRIGEEKKREMEGRWQSGKKKEKVSFIEDVDMKREKLEIGNDSDSDNEEVKERSKQEGVIDKVDKIDRLVTHPSGGERDRERESVL